MRGSRRTVYGIYPCTCVTCMLFTENRREDLKGECDFCLLVMKRSKAIKDLLIDPVPWEVRKFYNIKTICGFCMNSIDFTVRGSYALCWAVSSTEAINLALIVVLYHVFRREANIDKWYKVEAKRMVKQSDLSDIQKLTLSRWRKQGFI